MPFPHKIFVDLDGVLADFDQHHEDVFGFRPDKTLDDVNWKAIESITDYYLHIPPMEDMHMLWDYVRPYHPIILTGIPHSIPNAADNKRGWVAKHLGPHVPVVCCLSREKARYASPGDILIDDRPKYESLWRKAGGTWITHTSADETLAALAAMGI